MKTLIPLLFLTVACGGPRNLKTDALSAVPASSIDALSQMQSELTDAKNQLSAAETRQAELDNQLKSAEAALQEADVSMEKTRKAKADAVLSGNTSAAAGLDDDLTSSQERLQTRRDLVDSLTRQKAIAAQTVKVREAEIAWRDAALELARAEAASTGGADVEVADYRKHAEKLKSTYDKEQAAAQEMTATQ